VWKKPGSALSDQYSSGMVKFGGESLMLWDCMTPQGVGYMCRIDSRMYAELHTSILQDNSLAVVEFYQLDKQEINPKHTSQRASKWFKQNNTNVLKWHAQSPDLNLIEICGNTSSGNSMNPRSLLLVCMSFWTR